MISDFEYMAINRIIPAISDAVSDALFAVDQEKGDGIDTEDIRRYAFGSTPVEGEFPALSIMSLREYALTDEEEWRLSQFIYNIEVYSVHDDPTILEKKCARYARALKNVLWDTFKTAGTIQNIEYPPSLSRGSALFKGVGIMFALKVRENRSD